MIDPGFEALKTFLTEKMRMSHVYQPLMIRTLLENGGQAGIRDIAKAFLIEDESQIEYYEQIVKRYPAQVLSKHGIVKKDGKDYYLEESFAQLSEDKRLELISICNVKLLDYVQKRKMAVWEHRFMAEGYISGSIRYDILKRAKGRCECCGVSSEERAIDIDHIVPRNKGGLDDPSNLQALCYQCNRQKRDRDDTDFASIKASYNHRETGCLFCHIENHRVVTETALAYVIRDAYPVSDLHTLVIPKRHVAGWFDLYKPEHQSILALLDGQKETVAKLDPKVQGFNVGINIGEVAGQTIFHAHVHLIPRREGDVVNPRGGVRGVFADKAIY